MPTTPETTLFLILGLAVSFGFLLLLVGSMFIRYRNLLQDEQTITQLLEDDTQA